MGYDRIDTMYDALVKDGAQIGTREQFKKLMLAPGKQGYQNRLGFYNAMKADGASIGNSYEEFGRAIGLHAVHPKQQAKAPQRPQTTAQRAMQMGGRKLPTPKHAPQNASPFVQSLYEKDMEERGETQAPMRPVDYTSPKAVQNVNKRSRQAGQKAAKAAADTIVNAEQRRKDTPIMQTGRPEDVLSMTQGQLEQKMSDAADNLVASSGDFIKNSIDNEYKQATLNAENEIRNDGSLGNPFMGSSAGLITTQIANKYESPDKIMASLQKSIANNITSILPQAEEQAKALGVSPDTYLKQTVLPKMIDKAVGQFRETEIARRMPKNDLDYFIQQAVNSNTMGTVWNLIYKTKAQRQFDEEAMNRTNEGLNPNYKPSTALKVGAEITGMVTDPVFGASAKLGGAVAGKLLGNAVKTSAIMANGTVAQRLMFQGAQTVTSGAVTGLAFDSTNSVIQNFSTGEDTSLGNTLKVAAEGGLHGAVNFGIMGLAGVPLSQLGRSVGIKAGGSFWGNTGRAVGKVGLESAKTVMEGMGMYLGGYAVSKMAGATDANGKPVQFDLWNGTMESLPTAIGFRIQHALGGLKGGRKDARGESVGWIKSTVANMKDFLTSDKAKVSNMLMSEDEKRQIFNSGVQNGVMRNGENIVTYARKTKNDKIDHGDNPYLETDIEMMQSSYDKIMADPNVSWDAKAKFSAMVMGVMPDSRPMMDYHTLSNEKIGGDSEGYRKYVNEYSAKGELLSKREYDSLDERDKILYQMDINRENQRLWNAMGALASIDKNNYDYQNAFYMEGIKNAKDNSEIQAFVDGLGTKGSAVEQEFTNYVLNNGSVMERFNDVARAFGMETKDLVDAFNKDPMKRTEKEQSACVQLRREMEKQAFSEGKVHEEQSHLEGKDVAEDRGLGTEQPDGEIVKQELNNLADAEKGMEVLMRDNDVFSQNFEKLQKQGLTNPQIFDWMIQQGGLTEEQLKPFADYINANARVQGMQDATQQKIEENVGKMVQDWSYHGTMDGVKSNGEQVVYVTDRDGRMLIVGSGDVAFDSTTGRAKEDVGDMLVCLDPNTKEMVYVKAEDVTLSQKQSPEDFGNAYRQQLQEINSQPYNEAAAEQAERNTNAPQEEKEPTTASEEPEANENVNEALDKPKSYKVAESLQDKIGQSLSKDEADSLVSEMEERAEPARELELTPENWTAEFGEDGKVNTPLGEVKMGENQLAKLFMKGRDAELGMIKPTLTSPDVIIEEESKAADGNEERPSSYLFVKTFIRDGKKVKFSTSVTVKKDGMEVSVSSHIKSKNAIDKKMQEGKILYIKGVSTSNSSDRHLAEHPNGVPDLLPTQENDTPSVAKGSDNSPNGKESGGFLTHSDENYEKNDIPVDKEGEPVYEQVPKERTVEDLFGKLGGDSNLAHDFAEAKVSEAEKERNALQKKEPKMGTKLNEYLRKKAEYDEAVKAAENKVVYWNSVRDEVERVSHTTPEELKAQQEELDGTAAREEYMEMHGDGQPADGTALAARFIADAKITPESFKKETGHGTAEQKGFVGMIAKEENGGKSIERLAEDLVYHDNTEYNGVYFHGDTNEARNAIISALGGAKSRKELRDMAQPDMAAYERERAQARDEAYHERYGMDYEEYLAYSEQEMPHILEKLNNFDEEKYLHDKAEEITKQIDKEHGEAIGRDESAGEEPVHDTGSEVLPTERLDERRRGSGTEKHERGNENERRGDTEDATVSETAPGEGGISKEEPQPIGKGAFGNIYDAFKGKAKAAIKFLLAKKEGEAVGALHHKDVGDIDLVWGKEGTGHSDGFGLAKLAKYHPEVLDNLQEVIDDMHITSRSENRINLESDTHKASVRLEWDGEKKTWLLTAFKKETPASDKRTDTTTTSLKDDTALSQTEVSKGKGNKNSETTNVETEKTPKEKGKAVSTALNGEGIKPGKGPKTPIEKAAQEYHQEKVDAARKAYQEAKASDDESEIKRTRDELKKALNDAYKAQHMGLVQRRKLIAEEIGKAEAEKIDKPWSEMDGEERMATAEKNPLTEDEIRNKTSKENQDLIEDAVDYLNGNHGFAQQLAYLKIYDDVRNRHENAADNSGAENGAQLAPADTGIGEGLGLGTGRESGGTSGELGRGTGTEGISEQGTGRENSEGQSDSSAGERGDIESKGDSSRLGGLSSGDSERKGSGSDDSNGTTLRHDKGRGSGDRPAKPNAKRKPAAEQGTTWRNRTGAEIRQEAKEAKAGLKAALAEMKKR